MPEITVVVPVYNAEAYLKPCVESILGQTFSAFALILVDDGSTDGSGAICDRYAETDARVRVLHQENAGQSAARNRGVAEANTNLICFIDSDDIVHPTLLEGFLTAMRTTGAAVVTCERIRGETPPDGFFSPIQGETELLEINEPCLLRLLRENRTEYWTLFPCLMRKEIYEKHPLTPGRVMEDNAVACKWLAEAGFVAVLHAPLYFYRETPTGTMNAPFSPKKLDFLWALEEQLAFYEKKDYRDLQGAVAKEYILNALWFSKRIETELGDEKLARDTVKKAVRMQKRYADLLSLNEAEKRKLFQAAHPILYKAKKKFKGLQAKR